MQNTELVWRERTAKVAAIASVWTCSALEVTTRTVLADPCISIILVRSDNSAEIILRGPETKPRDEILIPGYTWTAIRLQPGIRLKHFPAQEFANGFRTLLADNDGRFTFEGVQLQFPSFDNAEQLIEHMQAHGLIIGKAIDTKASPRQGLSSKSYSRQIKQRTGLSPYKLQQIQRIHQALHLIKQGRPATTVAADLGFVDQAHLSRAAKQFLGHTPKELFDLPQTPKELS